MKTTTQKVDLCYYFCQYSDKLHENVHSHTLVHDFSDQSENKILTKKRVISEGRDTEYLGPPDFTKGKVSTELTKLLERLQTICSFIKFIRQQTHSLLNLIMFLNLH